MSIAKETVAEALRKGGATDEVLATINDEEWDVLVKGLPEDLTEGQLQTVLADEAVIAATQATDAEAFAKSVGAALARSKGKPTKDEEDEDEEADAEADDEDEDEGADDEDEDEVDDEEIAAKVRAARKAGKLGKSLDAYLCGRDSLDDIGVLTDAEEGMEGDDVTVIDADTLVKGLVDGVVTALPALIEEQVRPIRRAVSSIKKSLAAQGAELQKSVAAAGQVPAGRVLPYAMRGTDGTDTDGEYPTDKSEYQLALRKGQAEGLLMPDEGVQMSVAHNRGPEAFAPWAPRYAELKKALAAASE